MAAVALTLTLLLAAQSVAQIFAPGVPLGEVNSGDIWEASGLAASRQNPGVLWTHNDNRVVGTFFAVATNGALLGRYTVTNTIFTADFEDIAIGPGPSPRMQYIYAGNIGDNRTNRESIRVFRIPEPTISLQQSNAPPQVFLGGVEDIELKYPDGPQNAEALLVDPWTADLFIATKATNASRIYQVLRAALQPGAPVTLTFVREIALPYVSAGDISADGTMVVLRRQNSALLWTRAPGESVGDVLARTGQEIPVIGQPTEPNGEALGFAADGSGYFTVSEGFNPPIYFFARTNFVPPQAPQIVVGREEVWRYQDTGDDEGTNWCAPDHDDSYWSEGPAPLGYGQGDERTVISYGWSSEYKNLTTYFRKQFVVEAANTYTSLVLRLCFADGIAIYLNGGEIFRRNLAPNAAFDTPATLPGSDWQNVWISHQLAPEILSPGTNTLAVEVHRFDQTGPDLTFDLELFEGVVEQAAHFSSAPTIIGGRYHLDMTGPIGSLAVIEASSDLGDWQTAAELVLSAGKATFEEALTPGSRFFRIAHPIRAPQE
jgi:hypothetical protein